MAWNRESREKTSKAIEKVELRIALVAMAVLGVSAYLAHRGFEHSEGIRSAGELIDYFCLFCSFIVAVIAATSWWLRRTAKVPEHFDPAMALIVRARNDDGVISFAPDGVSDAEFRFLVPSEEELEVFVKWSEEDEAIGAANDLAGHQRQRLYQRWYRANPRHFLISQRRHHANADWVTVGISIILSVPSTLASEMRGKKLSVIDITPEDLTFADGERNNACLLYDTLIFSPEFRGEFTEFKRWHSIIHASCFAGPTAAGPVTMWIEPDNKKLEKSFVRGRYGAYQTFELASKHLMYELLLPNEQSVRASQFVMMWSLLRLKRLIPSPRGTASATAGAHED